MSMSTASLHGDDHVIAAGNSFLRSSPTQTREFQPNPRPSSSQSSVSTLPSALPPMNHSRVSPKSHRLRTQHPPFFVPEIHSALPHDGSTSFVHPISTHGRVRHKGSGPIRTRKSISSKRVGKRKGGDETPKPTRPDIDFLQRNSPRATKMKVQGSFVSRGSPSYVPSDTESDSDESFVDSVVSDGEMADIVAEVWLGCGWTPEDLATGPLPRNIKTAKYAASEQETRKARKEEGKAQKEEKKAQQKGGPRYVTRSCKT